MDDGCARTGPSEKGGVIKEEAKVGTLEEDLSCDGKTLSEKTYAWQVG